MNRVRQLFATTLLTVALAVSSTLAGDMPGGVIAPPPPAHASATGNLPTGVTSSTSSDASVTGDLPCGVTAEIDPVTGLALSVLQSLLALF